jgi:hypothetical protein
MSDQSLDNASGLVHEDRLNHPDQAYQTKDK